jgi:hypothetical protein
MVERPRVQMLVPKQTNKQTKNPLAQSKLENQNLLLYSVFVQMF